jgi:hypothetical protein
MTTAATLIMLLQGQIAGQVTMDSAGLAGSGRRRCLG